MKGLYTKVISGKYDPIPNHYSQDLKNMIKACLQVRSSERADCDQILRMPGLLNHVTGTLDNIQARKEDTESLLNTIRLPRKLGMITERMPASNYEATQQKKVTTPTSIERKLKATDSLK